MCRPGVPPAIINRHLDKMAFYMTISYTYIFQRKKISRAIHAAIAVLLLPAILVTGCRPSPEKEEALPPQPLREKIISGDINVELTIDPPVTRMDQDTILSIRISAPTEMEILLPSSLNDRLQGFYEAGAFDLPQVDSNGKTIYERRVRLTPITADNWRLAPFVIRTLNKSHSPPQEGWLNTPSIRIKGAEINATSDRIEFTPRPAWIAPNPVTLVRYLLYALLLAALIAASLLAVRRVQRTIKLHRMSPRERALRELQRLMQLDLIGKKKIKSFYLELTMIVRRYIERAHHIRAPEQTTEEFLDSVTNNPHFQPATVSRLKNFLEAADLVKFAGAQPEPAAIDNAILTARKYLEHDQADDSRREAHS